MSDVKWLSLLGLATRARKVISGEDVVLKEVRRERVRLVLIADDASSNTKKKMLDKCAYYDVPIRIVSDRKTLGKAVGKGERVVIGVIDEGFAKKIISLVDECRGGM